MSLIFVFADGVGLAPDGPDNPLAAADAPALGALLGGPLTIERAAPAMGRADGPLLLRPIDATLGVAGLPQSGTGQTALLAGVNAAALHGRHQPHAPPVALRPLLAAQNIFSRVAARGGRATFANVFGPRYWEAVAARRLRRSASVIAAEGAGLRLRTFDDMRAGLALAWDVTGDLLRRREPEAPGTTPRAAGADLARLARDHELVFFETFLPDLAGHGRLLADGADGGEWSAGAQIGYALRLIDGLLGGLLDAMRPGDTLLLTSDHGNAESLAAPAHTRNPVPLLAVGPGAAAFREVADIAGVADAAVRAALAG